MKINTRALLFLLFLTSLSLSACNKEEKQRERLDGKWIYESAKVQEKAFKKRDILDTYRYLDLYLTADGSVKIIDVKDSLVFEGIYEFNEETETMYVDEDGNNIPITKTQMLLSYIDTITRKQYQELWDIARTGKNKFTYETELDGKKAFFKLRRQLP